MKDEDREVIRRIRELEERHQHERAGYLALARWAGLGTLTQDERRLRDLPCSETVH